MQQNSFSLMRNRSKKGIFEMYSKFILATDVDKIDFYVKVLILSESRLLAFYISTNKQTNNKSS